MSPNDYLTLITILAVAVVISVWVVARHLSASRQARAQMQRILKEVE
jgi:hypothetical protein